MSYPKCVTTMTNYDVNFNVRVISPPQQLDNVLAEYLGKHGKRQCHVAETEKYAHVTFFFNGGREKEFTGEHRVLVPSPKVTTYDLKPEMSVLEVSHQVIEAIESGVYEFVICNLAPPDMVGHTGKFAETVRAVEVTGMCIISS